MGAVGGSTYHLCVIGRKFKIMELLNIGFAILLVKIVIAVMPTVVGIVMLSASEDTKRSWRNSFCRKTVGVSNAIPYSKFVRYLYIAAVLLLLFSMVAAWFLLLRGFF